MATNETNQDKQKNEELANYVDQLLAGEKPEPSSEDNQLAQLQQMAQQLHPTAMPNPITPEITNRIKDNLTTLWRQRHQISLWQRLQQRLGLNGRLSRRQRQGYALALAAIALLLVVMVAPTFTPQVNATPVGSDDSSMTLIFISIVALLGGILWFINRKK